MSSWVRILCCDTVADSPSFLSDFFDSPSVEGDFLRGFTGFDVVVPPAATVISLCGEQEALRFKRVRLSLEVVLRLLRELLTTTPPPLSLGVHGGVMRKGEGCCLLGSTEGDVGLLQG